MDTEEYELEYEAESPPRHSQQRIDDNGFDLETQPVAETQDPAMSETEEKEDERGETETQPTENEVHQERDASPSGSVVVSKSRKRPLLQEKEASVVASLMRKLKQYKKMNMEMRSQLQKFYQNEAIAFLENKAQEKQRQVDALTLENKTLHHHHRVLSKQVDELQDAIESQPAKRVAERDELRSYREQVRQYKEKQKHMEEKSTKMHQQIVDLATLNKSLVEKIKQLESEGTPTSPSFSGSSHRSAALLGQEEAEAVIASQEDAITRLQHRVDVMKKAIKLDRAKHEKEAQSSKDELDKAHGDLERFHHQAGDKEKVIRSQFLAIKQLKRSLKEALEQMHMNQQLHHAAAGRDVRFVKQQQLQHHHHLSTPHKATGVNGGGGGSGAQELLQRLGLLQLSLSPSKASSVCLSTTESVTSFTPRPPYQQHPTHAATVSRTPCPPHSSPRGRTMKNPTRPSAQSHVSSGAMSLRRKSLSQSTGISNFEDGTYYEDVDTSTFQSLHADERAHDTPSCDDVH